MVCPKCGGKMSEGRSEHCPGVVLFTSVCLTCAHVESKTETEPPPAAASTKVKAGSQTKPSKDEH